MLRGTNGAPRGVPGQQYAEPPAGFHDMLMPAGLSRGTPKRGANNMNRNAVHVCSVPTAETLMCASESSGTPYYRVRTVAGCLSGTSVQTVSSPRGQWAMVKLCMGRKSRRQSPSLASLRC